MSDIEGVLRSWFSRNHSEKAQNLCQDLGFVLSSDIGAVRDENQDRVAAMYTGSNSNDPVFVVAASDGMGGMRDGGVCSSTALSVFFSSLVKFGGGGVEERALKSLYEANRAVFDAYKGNGGATLTAILVNVYGNRVLAHVGDTRIYSFDSDSVERHTADDSLVEVVGGGGRGLRSRNTAFMVAPVLVRGWGYTFRSTMRKNVITAEETCERVSILTPAPLRRNDAAASPLRTQHHWARQAA